MDIKSVLGAIDLFSLANFVQLRGLGNRIANVFGIKVPKPPETEDKTVRPQEGNKGPEDEFNALVAAAEVKFGKSLSQFSDEELRISPEKFMRLPAIFRLLKERNLPAGAEKLMHIIGLESHLSQKKVQGGQSQRRRNKDKKDGTEEVAPDLKMIQERTNPGGRLIILFLTSISPEEAVDFLTAASITDTAKDKAAATAKASKEALGKTWESLKAWYREHDTEVHILLARASVGKEQVVAILESDSGKAHRQAIEAVEERIKTEKDKSRLEALREELHQKHEDLQRFLLGEVKRIQGLQAEPQQGQGKQPAPASRWNWKFFERVCYGVIGGSIVIAFVVQLINYYR